MEFSVSIDWRSSSSSNRRVTNTGSSIPPIFTNKINSLTIQAHTIAMNGWLTERCAPQCWRRETPIKINIKLSNDNNNNGQMAVDDSREHLVLRCCTSRKQTHTHTMPGSPFYWFLFYSLLLIMFSLTAHNRLSTCICVLAIFIASESRQSTHNWLCAHVIFNTDNFCAHTQKIKQNDMSMSPTTQNMCFAREFNWTSFQNYWLSGKWPIIFCWIVIIITIMWMIKCEMWHRQRRLRTELRPFSLLLLFSIFVSLLFGIVSYSDWAWKLGIQSCHQFM